MGPYLYLRDIRKRYAHNVENPLAISYHTQYHAYTPAGRADWGPHDKWRGLLVCAGVSRYLLPHYSAAGVLF